MAADVKHIKAQIDISAAKANAELSKLANKLEKISASISEINQKGLEGFTNSVEKMGQSMQILGNIDTSGLAHFADSVQRLSGMNFAGIGELSSALTDSANVSGNVASLTEAFGGLEAGFAALNGIGDIVTRFSDFKGSLEEMKKALESLFGTETVGIVTDLVKNLISPLTAHIGEFISYVSIGAGSIGESFSVAFGISAGAAATIVAAIVAAVLVIVDLWNTSEQFRNAVCSAFTTVKDTLLGAFEKIQGAILPLWESIKGFGAALYDFYESSGLKGIVEALATFTVILAEIVGAGMIELLCGDIVGLMQTIQGLIDIASGLVGVITGILTLDPEKMMEGFSLIGEGFLEVLGGIKEALFGGFEEIWALISEKLLEWWNGSALPFFQSIPEKFGELVESIGVFLSELPGKLGYWLGEALGSFVVWVTDLGEYLAEQIGKLIEDIVTWFSELPGKIYDTIILVIDKLGEWKEDIIEFITEKVPEIADKILEFFEDLPEKFLELGSDIIAGLWKGIQDMWEDVKKGIGDFCSGFVDGFRDALDIHSPSKAMAEIGDYAILGLLEPFSDSEIIIEQLSLFAQTLMNIFREQLSPENFALIAEVALLAFMETFRLGFENMQLASGESMQLLSMSVVNALTMMNRQIGLILTAVTMLIMQKWTLMLNQTRLIWLQMNQMIMQNLILLNTNITTGMTAVNIGWTARWSQFVSRVRSACTEVQAAVSALNNSVQGMCSLMMSAIRSVKAAASSMASVSVRTHTVRGFASGGYPETGELFLARENGMNEMVGRIGNRSAVANNDQIVEAIRGAVMQGIHAGGQNTLLREQNTLLRAILEKDTDISLDGRSLVDGIDRTRRRMGLSFQPA